MARTSLDKNKINILLLEGVHPSALEQLAQAGYQQIETISTALPEYELIEKIKKVHILGVRSRTQVNDAVLRGASRLIAVGCFCIGTNQVDLEQAKSLGIAVFNAPYSNTRSVAELVLAEAIFLLRGIPLKNAKAHQGVWQKTAKNSHEVRGKALGIVGYGNIGTQLGIMAESLGMKVYYYDTQAKLPMGNATPCPTLKELLAVADVISLHVPETPATHNMIGAEQLAAMKKNSALINASRGNVVDIDALSNALDSQHLVGAAIDVFPVEPRSNEQEFASPLRAFEQCILTPHVGGSTVEAQENIGIEVAEKLIKYSDNGSTISSVNFPEVALPAHIGKHRLLHVHKNIPGVLSEINKIFYDNSINISAQYLQTNDQIGYVVIDLDAGYSQLALTKLQQVPGTIKCRVLF